jgi:parallel beta-helix repeat protein
MHNIISNNTLLNDSHISIITSSENVVKDNVVMGSKEGLYVSRDSYNNVVFENLFKNNLVGISLGAQVDTTVWNNVYNNTFYENNFIDNFQDFWIAPGAPTNYWNNGAHGNYWSSYTGKDSNADGIGDTPLVLAANNQDNFPLMSQVKINNPSVNLPSIPTPTPTPTPPAQPTPTQFEQTPSPSATSMTPTNTPTSTQNEPANQVPEFSTTIIILTMFTAALTLLFARRKLNQSLKLR